MQQELIKYAFIDRDGTIAVEPVDTKQINSLDELTLIPYVISSLKFIQQAGYQIIIVSNQDYLGTEKNPIDNYNHINQKIIDILKSEGIEIQKILTCPHAVEDNCKCRKPLIGLVDNLLPTIDKEKSFMVGDRQTDITFANNIGIKGCLLSADETWLSVISQVKKLNSRQSSIRRTTNETDIELHLLIDGEGNANIQTGLSFFDHMLEQFAKHGQFDLNVKAHKNDLQIDEHHLIEDVAICLGKTFRESLQAKIGIERYSYEWLLPMDESQAHIAVDLSGRPYLTFKGKFSREYVGDFPTEMLEHFYHTFAVHAEITLQVTISGMNNHHQVECSFKALARCLQKASRIVHNQVSSTKGLL